MANRPRRVAVTVSIWPQVQASVLVTENEQIHDGVVTLVRDHGVTRLVMGSIPDK